MKYLWSLVLLMFVPSVSGLFADDIYRSTFEDLIHNRIYDYGFDSDNMLKLSAYCEMKGDYRWQENSLKLQFGGLGSITFFENHCLLRTYWGGIYHFEEGQADPQTVGGFNKALRRIFESIPLMGNYHGEAEKVDYIDHHLADKNFEPFDKLYLRNLLIKYGRWDKEHLFIQLHSSWLPENMRTDEMETQSPLLIKLFPSVLRGYYIKVGGTVYVEQLYRDGRYATGESTSPNVTAFKTFLQALFDQSVHFITGTESNRLQKDVALNTKVIPVEGGEIPMESRLLPKKRQKPARIKIQSSPYAEGGWMVMLMVMLRSNGSSIADPDILPFLKDQPYFSKLYNLMTPEERRKVDRQLKDR